MDAAARQTGVRGVVTEERDGEPVLHQGVSFKPDRIRAWVSSSRSSTLWSAGATCVSSGVRCGVP